MQTRRPADPHGMARFLGKWRRHDLLVLGSLLVLWCGGHHVACFVSAPVGAGHQLTVANAGGRIEARFDSRTRPGWHLTRLRWHPARPLRKVPHFRITAGRLQVSHLVLVVAWCGVIALRRGARGLRCPRCGYDLRASRGICPECGGAFTIVAATSIRDSACWSHLRDSAATLLRRREPRHDHLALRQARAFCAVHAVVYTLFGALLLIGAMSGAKTMPGRTASLEVLRVFDTLLALAVAYGCSWLGCLVLYKARCSIWLLSLLGLSLGPGLLLLAVRVTAS